MLSKEVCCVDKILMGTHRRTWSYDDSVRLMEEELGLQYKPSSFKFFNASRIVKVIDGAAVLEGNESERKTFISRLNLTFHNTRPYRLASVSLPSLT
jgi:retron-type reverse transcriptase